MTGEGWELVAYVLGGGFVGAAGKIALDVYNARARAGLEALDARRKVSAAERLDSREDRRDAIGHLEAIIARLSAELETRSDEWRGREDRYERDYRELHARLLRSEMERQAEATSHVAQRDGLLDQITRMQQVIESIKLGAEPWSVADPTLMAWLIFADDGTIRAAGSNIQPVLGWTESDLLRRPTSVKMLLPLDRHADFDAAMAEVHEGRLSLDPCEVRAIHAVTKWGENKPVYVTLRRRERDGMGEVVVMLRERYEDSSAQPAPVGGGPP